MLHWAVMRLAVARCRFSLPTTVAVRVLTCALVSGLLVLTSGASEAAAASVPLVVDASSPLSLMDESVTLSVSGRVSTSLNGARVELTIAGPFALSDIGKADIEAPRVAQIVTVLGAAPEVVEGPSNTTTTVDPALTKGELDIEVALPTGTPPEPGAYLITAQVGAAGEVLGTGQVWLGKVAARSTPLDVAFVLPLALGIHRDPDGAYFDRILEEAVVSGDKHSGNLRGLLVPFDRFPEWRFSLAVEPVLLTQLRDMADGYVRSDAANDPVRVDQDDPATVGAAAVLADLRDLVNRDTVETLVGPYAGADLEILAAEGWRDGLEQIQLGKLELQQTLGLETGLVGALAPDLDLTSASMTSYAAASIDHVVVDSRLMDGLTEPVDDGVVAVRTRNKGNDRATLVFASHGLSTTLAAPWDVSLLAAALAADLAAVSRDAVVVVPGAQFDIPPASYLEGLGEILASTGWIRTLTLAELIREHSPGSRPTLIETDSTMPQGYIEESLLDSLRSAHAAVADLAATADSSRGSVETAYRLLFLAESRWWSRPLTSPREASIGLAYATEALAVAKAELKKVRFVGEGSTSITGGDGVLRLVAESDADYPLTVQLRLSGSGITFPDGQMVPVELQPGRTELVVKVVRADGSHDFDAELVAGATVLDKVSGSVRFIGFMAVLPWLIVGLLVVAAAIYLIFRRYRRGRRTSGAV